MRWRFSRRCTCSSARDTSNAPRRIAVRMGDGSRARSSWAPNCRARRCAGVRGRGAGRGDLERRKLRELIEFCYTERCYRAHILDYFGDRHHLRECGACGNCAPREERSANLLPPAEVKLEPRTLTDDELLRVRKILACAKRMNGRFGKKLLAGTLRGSAAKQHA